MKNYKVAHLAVNLMDQQDDDSGDHWKSLAYYWPYDLPMPEIGKSFTKNACLLFFNGSPKYPVDTPSNTLASSMYFLTEGIKYLDKEACLEVASDLKNSREIWGVELPNDFVAALKDVSIQKEASYDFSSPEDTARDIELYNRSSKNMLPSERISKRMHLKEASAVNGIEDTFSYQVSENAVNALNLRVEVMQGIPDHPNRDEYINKIASISRRLSSEDPSSLISELENLDIQTDMSVGWDSYYPDPYESIIEGINNDPLSVFDFDKSASYQDIDWEGLSEVLEDGIVDQIKEDPENVIPTLPIHHKNIVESFRRR